VNGQVLSRDQFKNQLRDEKLDETSANMLFLGAVQVPQNPQNPMKSGTVGLFYSALVQEPFEGLGKSHTRDITSSLNLTIFQDTSLPVPTISKDIPFFDARRVSVLNEITVNKPPFTGPPTDVEA